jgi:hypothetical protein
LQVTHYTTEELADIVQKTRSSARKMHRAGILCSGIFSAVSDAFAGYHCSGLQAGIASSCLGYAGAVYKERT